MPSRSLQFWLEHRSRSLDQIEEAHRGLGGCGPGRRYAMQQVNHAYAVLLSAQFPGFCWKPDDESVDHLIESTVPAALWETFKAFLEARA